MRDIQALFQQEVFAGGKGWLLSQGRLLRRADTKGISAGQSCRARISRKSIMLGCVAMTPRRKARVPLVVLLLAFLCPGAAYLANAGDHEEEIEPSEEPQEIWKKEAEAIKAKAARLTLEISKRRHEMRMKERDRVQKAMKAEPIERRRFIRDIGTQQVARKKDVPRQNPTLTYTLLVVLLGGVLLWFVYRQRFTMAYEKRLAAAQRESGAETALIVQRAAEELMKRERLRGEEENSSILDKPEPNGRARNER